MMHMLAQSAVRDLVAQGVTLDPVADFDDLVELNRLALECENVSSAWKSRRAFFPTVGVANVTLRRLSIGARIFFAEEVSPHLAPDDCSQVAALAWVMAHSDRPDHHLWPLAGNPEAVRNAVQTWMKSLGATWEELDHAVAKNLATEQPARRAVKKSTEPDYCAICASLAENFGRDPVWWFWEAPEQLVAEMMDTMDRKADAMEQRQRADAVASGQRLPPLDASSRFIRCRKALAEFKQDILNRKRGTTS